MLLAKQSGLLFAEIHPIPWGSDLTRPPLQTVYTDPLKPPLDFVQVPRRKLSDRTPSECRVGCYRPLLPSTEVHGTRAQCVLGPVNKTHFTCTESEDVTCHRGVILR